MKQFFLLIFIFTTGVVSSQPFKSIFGSNSTMWIIKWYNLDFGGIDTIVVEKDTLAYGFNWKKIVLTYPYGFFMAGGLLREDTIIGKVWYHPLEPGRDSTYLAFDFALETGETFDLSSNYDPWLNSVIVDSIVSINGSKRIQFHSFIEQGENIEFIEGIGGNQGPIYKESSGLLYPYLLCAYKDGIQTYSNISYEGNCNPPTGVEDDLISTIDVYPNPVDDILYINNFSNCTIRKAEVLDVFGRIIYSKQYNSMIIFNELSAGHYYLRLITDKGQSITKSFIRR